MKISCQLGLKVLRLTETTLSTSRMLPEMQAMKQTSSVKRYRSQPEGLRVPDPQAPDYVGTYTPPAPYKTRQRRAATTKSTPSLDKSRSAS